ncbi:hypothetical protein K474DRAFT_1621797 [Panus rudis PR-1116 ss-1]|nr:hypothetical protein K474DRAFT_1621797 [Panus rudis PR-1116 ss-1]
MRIPVQLNLRASVTGGNTFPPNLVQFGTDEIVLIELQGSLEVEGDHNGQTVGKLTVDPATKKATLFIGYHLLEGKLVNLSKPLAVMYRPPKNPISDRNEETSTPEDQTKNATSWDIVAVVKRKMVFAKRPMPMVGKTTAVSSVSLGKKLG